ncbi:MAG: hypothetical protein ACON4Z_00670 [Planctomycetota bacterium]
MSSFARRLSWIGVCLLLLVTAALRAQEPAAALDPRTAAALRTLAEELAEQRRAIAAGAQAPDAGFEQLRWEFAELASHLDVRQFEQPDPADLQLEQEVLELLAPLVDAVKTATAAPRELAALRKRADALRAREQGAAAARRRTEATRDVLPAGSAERDEAAREVTERWDPLLEELRRELLVVDANLRRREASQVPMWTRVTDNVQRFLQSSGLNVLLCVVTFLVVFFGLRWVGDLLLRRKRARGFSIRLAEVLLRVLNLLLAVAATMSVLYARGDWLLLPIGIIFLVGAGWVVVKAAPIFFEQVRLILNVGPVREGERLLVDGLPYRVEALQFYSRLVNPELEGGLLRVPVQDLVGMRSRPLGSGEPWFPCRKGDVVALDDGVVGVVTLQTPEVVVLVERRDAPRTYPTVAFLAQHPRNLSAGFELYLTFRVDFRHLPDAAGAVPEALRAAVRAGVEADRDGGALRDVRVEVEAAEESAIRYAVLVEFDGAAAARYHDLHRAVNQLLVAACVAHGLVIPLPQLRIRGAAPQPPASEASQDA